MSEPAEEPEVELRALERRLRRDKLRLERLNPLERAEEYEAALAHVLDLEVERRRLRALVQAEDPPLVIPDDDRRRDRRRDRRGRRGHRGRPRRSGRRRRLTRPR